MVSTRRQTAKDIAEDEADELQNLAAVLSGDSLLPDIQGEADYVVTGAQLAMLQEEGGARVSLPGADEAPDIDYGQTIFQIGQGRSKFTVKLADDTGDHEKVYVYDTDGERWPVKRANILYYRAKGFHLRPPRGIQLPEASFKCRSKLRPHDKVFRTSMDAEDHFRTFHAREYRSEREERQLMAEGRMDALLDQLSHPGGTGDTDTKRLIGLVTELLSRDAKKEKAS